VTATCDPGDIATGGGFNGNSANVQTSRPFTFGSGDTPTGWQVSVSAAITTPPGPNTQTAYVVCADITP
jgi:hypothetical protein